MTEIQRFDKPEPRKPKVSKKGARNKGRRFELKVAKELGGKRMPLSGAAGGGDVVLDGYSVECKKRASLPALLKGAFAQAERDIGTGDPRRPLVIIEEDHGRAIVCQYMEDWKRDRDNAGPTNSFAIRGLAQAIRKLATDIESKAH